MASSFVNDAPAGGSNREGSRSPAVALPASNKAETNKAVS